MGASRDYVMALMGGFRWDGSVEGKPAPLPCKNTENDTKPFGILIFKNVFFSPDLLLSQCAPL